MKSSSLFLLVVITTMFIACEGDGGIITSDPNFKPNTPILNGDTTTAVAIDTLYIASSDHIRVYDGDTFTYYGKERTVKVRLYGIDAPEKDQTYGIESTKALQAYLYGQNFTVYIDSHDKYGRAIGRIYRGDVYVNLEMIRTGSAWWYQYFAPHESAMEQAFTEAKNNKRGLWALPNPQNPYDYRKGR